MGRGQGDGDKGTGTWGRVCGDLGLRDARRGTSGHQVWDAGDVWDGDAGTTMIIEKVGGKCGYQSLSS